VDKLEGVLLDAVEPGVDEGGAFRYAAYGPSFPSFFH
jgi:hypothetical protein